ASRHDDVGVFNRSCSRNFVRLRHFNDQIWISNVPAFYKNPRRRSVLRISLDRSRVGPSRQGVDFLLRQRGIILKVSYGAICVPRRHFPRNDSLLDGFGPWPNLIVRRQRHRTDLPWPVAALAALLKNPNDVVIKGHAWFGGRSAS